MIKLNTCFGAIMVDGIDIASILYNLLVTAKIRQPSKYYENGAAT